MSETSGVSPSQMVPVVVTSEAPADEQPSRVVFFLPDSAIEPGLVNVWSLLLVQGGQAATLEIEQTFEVLVTCEMFSPDPSAQVIGQFRSQRVRLRENKGVVEVRPVLGANDEFLGVQVCRGKSSAEGLQVQAAASLDRPVTVHLLQNGRDLFEARRLSPGNSHEFKTSKGFALGFQVARLGGLYDLNGPLQPGPIASAFLAAKELGDATTIAIQGSINEGYSLELGHK